MHSRIKSYLKNTIKKTRFSYKFYSQTKAFKNRYKKIDNSLFKHSLPQECIDKYIEKWKVLGVKVEIDTFLLCYNLSGKIDYNIVPENIFAAIIEPRLNKYKDKELSFFSVKNIYEKWFNNKKVFPKSYFHKIDNIFYDQNFNVISNIDKYLEEYSFKYPLICKPSMNTSGGVGVSVIDNINQLKKCINVQNSFVCQEKIRLNPKIEQINHGISSVRTCLYRHDDGKFRVINNSIRFGVDGGLDNEAQGGLACNINKQGRLNDYAVNKYCERHYQHPNSQISFTDITIPNYEHLLQTAIEIADQIPLCNLVSLDMCLDINSQWRCFEINLRSQTIRFTQYSGSGFFGDYTEEIIKKVLELQ